MTLLLAVNEMNGQQLFVGVTLSRSEGSRSLGRDASLRLSMTVLLRMQAQPPAMLYAILERS